MSQPMPEPEAGQPVLGSLQHFGNANRFEFKKIHECLVVKDIHQVPVLNVRSCDSLFRAQRELVHANGATIAKLKKNLPTLHSGWTVYSSSGEKLFSLFNTHMFPKRTSISMPKVKDLIRLSLDAEGLAAEDIGLGAEGPILVAKAGFLSAEKADLAAKDASLCVVDMARSLRGVAGSLSAERAGLAAAFVDPASEKAAWEKEYQEKGSEYLNFQFKGSWTSKACAMYVAGSETKIAQMHPLEDNTTEGFYVDVDPNANWEVVIPCFAAVETMKSDAQKQKEFLGHVAGFTGKFIGGVFFGAGKFCFECVSNGC